jgi:uncharacterized protein YdaU (DUF1376 family)
MTVEEEGCYIRLLAYCWREGSIPSDPEKLACLCKGIKPNRVVQLCFKVSVQDSNRLVHERLEREREKQAEWRSKCADGGRHSAGKRKHPKQLDTEQGSSTNLPRVVTVKGNSSSSSSSSISILNTSIDRRKRRASTNQPIPEGFHVSDNLKEWASKAVPNLNVEIETENFLDHHRAKGSFFKDWDAAWRKWMRNANNWAKPNGAKPTDMRVGENRYKKDDEWEQWKLDHPDLDPMESLKQFTREKRPWLLEMEEVAK